MTIARLSSRTIPPSAVVVPAFDRAELRHGIVHIGLGTRILPGVFIEGNVVIGANCKIGPNCYIRGNTSIGDHCHIGIPCRELRPIGVIKG